MHATVYAAEPQEYRTFTPGRKWLSENDDKAWGEKLYLWFIPVFFLLTGISAKTGLSPISNVWNLALGFVVWLPYCVILPLTLRRNQPLPFWKQWWFKFQIYMAVIVFIMSYFGTEYFFDVLGMRYDYKITWYLDSALLGPDQGTALAQHKRVPLGMYPLTMAFFTLYHAAAVVMMRRLVNFGRSYGPSARRLAFVIGLFATSFFFAWAETMLFMSAPSQTSWYEDTHTQLTIGSLFYAVEFLFFFANIYWLDERADQPPWRWPRIMVEAAAMCMGALIVQDVWTLIFGAPFAGSASATEWGNALDYRASPTHRGPMTDKTDKMSWTGKAALAGAAVGSAALAAALLYASRRKERAQKALPKPRPEAPETD